MRARRQGAGDWRAIVVPAPRLAGCAPEGLSFLTPAGPVAAAERAHLLTVRLIALIVVAPVLIGVPLIAWRYRRRRRAAYAPGRDSSHPARDGDVVGAPGHRRGARLAFGLLGAGAAARAARGGGAASGSG